MWASDMTTASLIQSSAFVVQVSLPRWFLCPDHFSSIKKSSVSGNYLMTSATFGHCSTNISERKQISKPANLKRLSLLISNNLPCLAFITKKDQKKNEAKSVNHTLVFQRIFNASSNSFYVYTFLWSFFPKMV